MYLAKLKEVTKKALKEKDRDLRAFYQTLLSDAELLCKEEERTLDDSHVTKAAMNTKKAFEKGIKKAKQEASKRNVVQDIDMPYGYDLLDQFIPQVKKLSESELNMEIEKALAEGKNLGQFMGGLAKLPEGSVDKGLASRLFKEKQ